MGLFGPPNIKKLEKKGKTKGLITILTSNKNLKIRAKAITALGKMRSKDAVEPLIQAFSDKNSSIRKKIADALGNIGDKRAVESLICALKDKNSQVRYKAAEALSKIDDPRARVPLIQILNDKNEVEKIRTLSVEGLVKANDPRVRESLIQILKDKGEDENIRSLSVEVLGKLEDFSAIEPLIQILNDKNEDERIRSFSAKALGKIKDKKAKEPLFRAFENEDLLIQISAAEALLCIGDPRPIDLTIKSLFRIPTEGASGSIPDDLKSCVPYSLLTKEIVNWTKNASSYQHKFRGYKYDAGYITLEASNAAIRCLCNIKSQVTSNILHCVAQKKDVSVTMSTGCSEPWTEKVSFENQREKAKRELKSRGDPPYQPEAYLIPEDKKGDQTQKKSRTEMRKERARRYKDLLALVNNPRTNLGENKWTYYDELAEDFKTQELFDLLVRDLISYQYIDLSILSRFESLLVKVGEEFEASEVRRRLMPIKSVFPNSYSSVINRIEGAKSHR
jgi:HEAT repeat protein